MERIKGANNERERGVPFEEAVIVFDDPIFALRDASRNDESRNAVIGFGSTGHLLTVVHVEYDSEYIRIISAWRATAAEKAFYDQ